MVSLPDSNDISLIQKHGSLLIIGILLELLTDARLGVFAICPIIIGCSDLGILLSTNAWTYMYLYAEVLTLKYKLATSI